MAQTPEGKVKKLVVKVLKEFGVYYHMPVQAGFGKPSLDFICCVDGLFFAVETKAAGKKPTKRQEVTMAEMRASGAVCFVVSNLETLEEMREFIKANSKQGTPTTGVAIPEGHPKPDPSFEAW